ncbi:MAG TPA: cytochrome P450 [Acidimicrobiales bacterium]
MAPDLISPAFYGDIDGMHEAFRELRQQGPLWHDEANGLLAVLGHPELIEVERRNDLFSSESGYRSFPQEAGMERDMIALDDPDHAAQRALVSRRLTPRAVKRLEPLLGELITDLIDGFIADGEFEVVDQLAAPLPAWLTAHLLGFPPEQASLMRSCSERLMRIDQVPHDPDTMAGFMGAIMEFSQELGPLVEERQSAPRDDLLSVWAHSELDGCPMDMGVITQETGLFISGGAETTRTVISRGLVELSRHPDVWGDLAEDASLIPDAVEELIRWVTPLNNFFRTVTADTEIAGTPVAKDDRVVLLYPSANRDERVFDRPYEFNIRRDPNPHVSFGFGTHFCVGASLARLELRLLLEALTSRLASIEVSEPPDIEPNVFVGAVRSCRFGFEAR